MERITLPGAAEVSSRLVVGLEGPALLDQERIWLQRYRPSGVILFRRNVVDTDQLRALCGDIRHVLGEDVEIVADQEGGPISVLEPAVGRPPAAFSLGRLDDEDLTRRVHEDSGRMMAAVGVTRVLAPCCDVLVEERNAVIGMRAFGREASLVARQASAAVRGLLDGGLDVCLKHWPGHGGTAVDSHEAAVTVTGVVSEQPFRAGLHAGADALMIGHLPIRSDGDPLSLDGAGLPALRREIPDVDLWCDDLTMAAVRPVLTRLSGTEVEGKGLLDPAMLPWTWLTVAAQAGCDRLLVRGIPWGALPLSDDGLRAPSRAPAKTSPQKSFAEPESWATARCRGARPLGTDYSRRLWFDKTREQRWQTLEPAVAGIDLEPLRLQERNPLGHDPGVFFLISSHGPLDPQERDRLAAMILAASREMTILVLGHPSLASDLAEATGGRVPIHAGFDPSIRELEAWLRIE